jgi:hypothetical protein
MTAIRRRFNEFGRPAREGQSGDGRAHATVMWGHAAVHDIYVYSEAADRGAYVGDHRLARPCVEHKCQTLPSADILVRTDVLVLHHTADLRERWQSGSVKGSWGECPEGLRG